jgi:hypothetical protein
MGVWACGRVGVWACGRVGVWACGRVGVWACRRVGVWACRRVGVQRQGSLLTWIGRQLSRIRGLPRGADEQFRNGLIFGNESPPELLLALDSRRWPIRSPN